MCLNQTFFRNFRIILFVKLNLTQTVQQNIHRPPFPLHLLKIIIKLLRVLLGRNIKNSNAEVRAVKRGKKVLGNSYFGADLRLMWLSLVDSKCSKTIFPFPSIDNSFVKTHTTKQHNICLLPKLRVNLHSSSYLLLNIYFCNQIYNTGST